MTEPTRILIADDHPLMRSGIRAHLDSDETLEVIAEASDGNQMQRLCEKHVPDLVIMDISMPGPSFKDRVSFIKTLGSKLLVLTAFDDTIYVQAMFRAGVEGYVLKDEVAEALVAAVKAVSGGGTYFSRRVLAKLNEFDFRSDALGSLTPRERDVLALIAQGDSNADISESLSLAEQTVRNYVSRIYEKTGISSRVELAVWAHKHGIVESDLT